MILTFDVGNTSIAICGISSEGQKVHFLEHIATALYEKKDGYLLALRNVLSKRKLYNKDITGTIISSVVPGANRPLLDAIYSTTGTKAHTVSIDDETGLKLEKYDKNCLGIDRLVCAAAATRHYGTPVMIYDLGTASTLSVVDKDSYFVGGSISPGVQLSLDALGDRCAKLPNYKACDMPLGSAIGSDAKECMEIGAMIGTASMIDGMMMRVRKSLGCEDDDLKVVITGGNAPFVFPHLMDDRAVWDPYLIHKGLAYIFELNHTDSDGYLYQMGS